MKTTELKYTKRFNVGPYEHEEMTVHALLDESGEDDATECLTQLKAMVSDAHKAGEIPATETLPPKPGKGKGKNENKNGKGKSKDKETEEVEETEEEETDETTEVETEELDGTEEEDEDPPPKKASKGKLKVTPYSRTDEVHKKLFATELAKINPKWKASEASKKKAKELSKELQGEDFLGSDGEVLSAFKVAMKKGMK